MALSRGLTAVFGAMIAAGWAPTIVEANLPGGWKSGLVMMAMSHFLPAGAFNRGAAKPGEPVERAAAPLEGRSGKP